MKYKLFIAMLFAMYACFLSSDIYRILGRFWSGTIDCTEWFFNLDISVACLLFEVFHWFFTSHYLQVACIFKLTFQDSSNAGFEIIKRRKTKLKIIDYAVYLIFIVCFIISVIDKEIARLLIAL